MSSTYRIFCLSHDPALETDVEFQVGGTNNPAASKRAAETPVPGHEHCDLIIAQYSGGLIALSDSTKWHADWVEKDWLRLLYAAHLDLVAHGDAMPGPVVERLSRAWPRERLHRLRDLLDLT